MRFLRLKIANYRGVSSAEVHFRPEGITLIQGPNEAGKTSLGEAIALLFEFPDNSKHRNVEAIRPVHRDEGPEIELQAESGPYGFTYFKRFHRKPETTLTITRPRAENLTGREAHDRASAILQETLDITLWKALTIQQGEGIQQPPLAKQTTLSAALDKAAGGLATDPRQEGVFDNAHEEYLRYYTERGAERKELTESRNVLEDAESEVARIDQSIRNLDQDTERAEILQRELARLKKQEEELKTSVAGYAGSLEEIAALESALSEARLKLESAGKSEQAARRDKDARQELMNAADDADRKRKAAEESAVESLADSDQAEKERSKAEAEFDEADRKRKGADRLAALRRADFDYFNNKLHLEQMQERKDRIDEARQQAAKARETLAGNKVDARRLKAIREAERGLVEANARLQTAAPGVLLRGLADCRLAVNGAEVRLGEGEVRTFAVADRTRLSIPEVLDVEITAGSSAEGLSEKVEEARLVLEKSCRRAGVSTPEEAQSAFDQRQEAIRHVEELERVEKDKLRDLTYEELDRKLRGLHQTVPEYLANRVEVPPIAGDLDSAKRERTDAELLQKNAGAGYESARGSLEAVRSVRDALYAKYQESKVQLDLLSVDVRQAHKNLDRARKNLSDENLETALTKAIQTVASEDAKVRAAEESLKAKNPEQVKLLAQTAKGSLQTTQNRRNDAQTELIEVQTRLKVHGEEGLHEKLHTAQSGFERLAAKNKALFRRATAAKCLFETLREERDRARRAYVAPLKERIEALGRLVFDDSFQVEITQDLQIARRTLGSVTIPFDFLSGGTKEQLSLVFRLACSMIVAKEGGTPLILDDALGYTDPQRLHLLGAVLAKAAKDCQIIVFTCMPDRYANVGEATVIALK